MRPHRWLVVAMTSALLFGVPATGYASVQPRATAQQEDPSKAAERDMKRQSNGRVTVERDERGVVEFVGTERGKPVHKPAQAAQASRERQAAQYLRRYGALWALDRAGSHARATRASKSRGAGNIVRFQQSVDGLPVLGGELVVAMDGRGNLRSVTGETTPLPLSQRERSITPAQARSTAIKLAARAHDVPESALRASEPEPYAYDPALLGSATVAAELAPVFKIEVTGPPHIDHLVLVDRTRGSVPLNFNQVSHALDRVVCDRDNTRDGTDANGNPRLAACKSGSAARNEGDFATGNADVDAAYDYAGDTAQYFQDELGVDLTTLIGRDAGSGKKIRSTVRYCLPQGYGDCPMMNAFWNGNGVYYGQGMPRSDDVVAHELTHGVIEQTANLMYWYQSGAINESMADVFGELVDLNNADTETEPPWKLGEDSPFGIVRDMADPEVTNQPDRMTSATYSAESVDSNRFDNGGVHTNSGVGNKAAYLIARDPSEGPVTFNGHAITGIGHTKATDVYYESLQLLASGADYEDLFHTLRQACTNLIGTGGIASGDCDAVTAAVAATEMDKQPSDPDARAPEAPVCPTDTEKVNLFRDGFGSLNNWRTTPGMWHLLDSYAKSGTRSMYGWEPNRKAGERKRTFARIKGRFEIPRGVKTFLRFDHQYLFAHRPASDQNPASYFAGGVLQYSTNGGKSFKSAAKLPWVNGPDETIEMWSPKTGSLAGTYKGFGGDSRGYMSSRLNVSSLGGKKVIFRWRITADPEVFFDGWTLDNVNLYACGGDRASSPANMSATGKLHRAVLRWQPPVWDGDGDVRKYSIAVRSGGKRLRYIDNISADTNRFVVRKLRRNTTYNFRVRAHNATGPGAFNQHRLKGTTVAASSKPKVLRFGRKTTIKGTLFNPNNKRAVRWHKVVLRGKPKGADKWRTIDRMRTDGNGRYSFTHKPYRHFHYRVFYWSNNKFRMGTKSDVRRAWVRQKVTAWFNDYRPSRGQWVALRGRVAPKHAGQIVRLQQWDRGENRWKTIRKKKLNKYSKYKFSLRKWRSRWFAFRVVKPGHFDHKRGVSPVRRIYVS
ncbi:Zinc metalloprotease (elastase) [Haloechinothrix halophila YIM 93223]|uniref:Zinc metalloprotease (Elastase) n=2 Tax=Haloechinothrix TaxID=1425377 RepID=W9DSN6_9PSEU|nr:Zinc metalloprotease (elastase) [Haloechinothrix halophila YIM 93223]